MNEKDAVYALRKVKEALDKADVEFWLDSGTLLGAVRDGKIMPWDSDIDLGGWRQDFYEMRKALQNLPEELYVVPKAQGVNISYKINDLNVKINITLYRLNNNSATTFYLKPNKSKKMSFIRWALKNIMTLIYDKKNAKIIQTNLPCWFLGIFAETFSRMPLRIRNTLIECVKKIKNIGYLKVFLSIPARFFNNLTKIEFYGMEFNTPSPVDDYLEYRYGEDWRTPKKDYVHYKDDQAIIDD